MESGDLGHREQLHIVQTVFTILSGQGEMLTIDPCRFYTHLYRNLLNIHAGTNSCAVFKYCSPCHTVRAVKSNLFFIILNREATSRHVNFDQNYRSYVD